MDSQQSHNYHHPQANFRPRKRVAHVAQNPYTVLEGQRKIEREALGNAWKTDIFSCIKRRLMIRRATSAYELQDLLDPALASHLFSLYQRLGSRCPLSGVRLVCDSGMGNVIPASDSDESEFGITRLVTTGRFVVNNVLPVAKWITTAAVRTASLNNVVSLAIETKRFVDFCGAHSDWTRVACCKQWAALRWSTHASVIECAQQLDVPPPHIWPMTQNSANPYFERVRNHPQIRATYDIAAICRLFEAQGGVCYMTGLPMWPGNETMAPSLDRIDNTRGHTVGNVLFSLHWANLSRGDAADPNFLPRMLCRIANTNPTLSAFTERIKHIQAQ